jgi:dynein heavy chain
MCDAFYQELRRRNYTTPTSYLELINLFLAMLTEKRADLSEKRDRYRNGLQKLYETQEVVNVMQEKLSKLQPELERKAVQTEALLKQIAVDTKSADEVKAVVSADEAAVRKQTEEAEALAAEAKRELDIAMPALQSAIDSLQALNKNDITEIKSFAKPPALVQTVMEAVCVLLNQKPDWATSKTVLGDTNFMSKLFNFDKDNIPAPVLKKLQRYIEMEDFVPDIVERVSRAAKSLCMWVRAMNTYSDVAKNVAPKRARLQQVEEIVAQATATLRAKQDELRAVEERVATLQRDCDEKVAERETLQRESEITASRLDRAGRLISGLGGERARWEGAVQDLDRQIGALAGNVFLAAACIAYFGAFTGAFRQRLVQQWVARCQEKGIPVVEDFALRDIMSDPVQVREWIMAGLPTDTVSVDSGVLVTRGRRWPLMIDPQGQANKWIKAMEQRQNLKVIKSGAETNFLRTLESAIRMGTPVLMEDVGEALEPALEPVLLKQTFRQGQRVLIHLGDQDVDYNPTFKFYMTTKMANPHYLPEICVKVTVINFTVTMKGLEDQLLGDVVRKEKPKLEEQKNTLVVSMATDKKALKDLEDRILGLLKSSEGNILDNEPLIATLNDSKTTSQLIEQRVKQAEETEVRRRSCVSA